LQIFYAFFRERKVAIFFSILYRVKCVFVFNRSYILFEAGLSGASGRPRLTGLEGELG